MLTLTSDIAVGGGRGGSDHGGLETVARDPGVEDGAWDGGQTPEAGLQGLDLLMLLVLLTVGKLDYEGGAASLHGQAVVHRLDRHDRHLPVDEGHEGAAWGGKKQI